VITEERALSLLSEANPVPDASTLDVNGAFSTSRLAEYDARSKEMTELEIDKSESTRVARRWPVVVGAVAAVAVVVIGVLILWPTRDQAPVAGQPTTPIETAEPTTPIGTAEAFLQAYYGRFDVDQAFTYLGADPGAVGLDTAGAANYHLLARFFEATGSKLIDLQCEEGGASPGGAVVVCTWFTHDFFSGELGFGPFGPHVNELTLVAGKVVSIVDRSDEGMSDFSNQIWQPFAAWVGENHPDDQAVMYDPYPTGWRITEESIPVWEQRLREYVAEVKGQAPAEDATIALPGLPPEGATPSTPENGELVASMWEHIGAPGSFGNGWLYLYADGRLIWQHQDPAPATGGWLEQRLTPEGVELIRSEIIATGFFDPDQTPPEPNGGFPREVYGGSIQVRNGDRLVYVNRVVPELMERLAELWSWLPEEAWEDTDAKAFVPSRYAVCLNDDGTASPDPDVLSLLPAATQDLLSRASQLQMDALVAVDPAGFALEEGSTMYCYDMTTEDARILAATLDEGGVEMLPHRWYDGGEVFYILSKTVAEYNRNPFNTISLAIWPMLPHGFPAFTGA